jgi:molybdopterin-guanine dinucleotide biosynthesis protein A
MPVEMKKVTGVILAGGKSSRMGTDKGLMEFQGEKMIRRTMDVFKRLFRDIIIVTNRPLDYLDQDAMIVTDIFPGKGPIGGIHTGLFFSPGEHAFFAACDMPYFNTEFISFMINSIGNFDIVVPETEKGFQPLHAVYSRKCLHRIKTLIGEDRLKVTGFYKGFRTLAVTPRDIARFDPENRIFFNVNTPEDLRGAS